ncbi:UDP-N-acetyl-D-mannosamine dehydrogenase [Oligella urethralis]|uniref:UDP-N-acetyl-D-mannosamine dehydrogenase n=1 Tax=Oligella urethralis TaxID=90245 RepID=UPI000CFFEFC2|nr:UDP-N-acetyl-D-mannosamine dehydrogenase [Oligella urethralis]AVL71588.1 UDP-N-acetyl-D-mannosamine dehydrogenase [Oligella urethralis]
MKSVSVIGLGYIGLPAAAMFASQKVKVIGVDVNQKAIDTINQGKIHIVEPGLEEIVKEAVSEGWLRATPIPEKADAFVIAVPTPFKGEHEPDTSYIQAVANNIAPVLEKGNVIILESTSPVGTTDEMIQWLEAARPDLKFPHEGSEDQDIYVAYCPERVLPGQVVRELVENDRIIGGITDKCADKAIEVYRIFVQGELFKTNARTAEMAKLTENAYRDVNIAFANELSLISDKLDINVWELISLANRHPRVNILQPGCGVGGHCIAVDPWFIVNRNPEEAKIIRAAREINDGKPQWVIDKVVDKLDLILKEKSEAVVSILGLAFKPNIDDLRESPALAIAKKIEKLPNIITNVVEPNIEELPSDLISSNLISLDEAKSKSDVLIVLVLHDEFKDLKKQENTLWFVQ